MEQLSFTFPPPSASSQQVRVYRDGRLYFGLPAGSIAEAQSKRRSLVSVLRRNPTSRTVWEDEPRPTGWWGVKPGHTAATTFCIVIEATGSESNT